MSIKYSIIIPVYNEELLIKESYLRLTEVMQSTKENYELVFVNDGSTDKSPSIIAFICKSDPCVKLLNFSRNFGHQPAITAGMDYSIGDAIIIIDADLQDPPKVMLELIEKWKEGYDVVYGKRRKRSGESLFKKVSAKLYYRVLKNMTSIDIPVDTGDFRLIDRKVCNTMMSLEEKNRYVRGLVSWVGYKQISVEYDRDLRFAGVTKYPLKKMLKFAIDGITSFSHKPLKLASSIGFILSFSSFVFLVVVLFQSIFTDTTVEGWASIVIILLFTQGVVLMVLGIIGEYIGRLYDEVKNRPLYIIENTIGYEENLDEQ
jgi:polyisoprenyl-phosphate glycosyltransferase